MLDDLVSSGQSDVWWSYLRTNFIFLSDVQLEKLGQISCWMQFQDESVTQWLLNWMKQQERNFMLGKIVAPLWHTSTLSLLSSSAHSLCSTYLWLSSWTILTILPEIHLSWDLTIWVNLSLHGLNTILEEGKSRNFFLPTKLLKRNLRKVMSIFDSFSVARSITLKCLTCFGLSTLPWDLAKSVQKDRHTRNSSEWICQWTKRER